MDERPTHLDTFSGICGFALAAIWSGFETIGFSEIEPFCCKWIERYFPTVTNYGDIKNITRDKIGSVDLLTGGFPCQPFSIAGKQRGISDERFLWDELARVVSEVRPRFALIENVPGIFTVDSGRTINRVFSDLSSFGYDLLWNCIPASTVGAPHQRDRLWILAYSNQERCDTRSNINGENETKRVSDFNWNLEEKMDERRQFQSGSYPKPCTFVADDRSERIQGIIEEETRRFQAFSWCENVRGIEDLRNRSDIPEPIFRGTCDGIPDWMDRIAAIGNSICPQVAYEIIKPIYDIIINEKSCQNHTDCSKVRACGGSVIKY